MKYGFIGCGNMGSALAGALSRITTDIAVCDRNPEKAKALAEKYKLQATDLQEVCESCERIFLAIKPQGLDKLADDIYDIIVKNRPVIITMLAGVKTATVGRLFSEELPVIRIMPNTPVGVGEGVVLYCGNAFADEALINDFLNDMQFAGSLIKLDEELIDAGCAVSGCGPAYMYMMADAVAAAGEKCGIERNTAVRLAALTMLGSARMMLESEKSPEQLKTDVCSPGGSTIEGVKVLKNASFKDTVSSAVEAAYRRNRELGGN